MLRVSVLWGLAAMQGIVLSAVTVRADAVAEVRAISSQIAKTFSAIEQGEVWVRYRCDYDSLRPGLETNLPWMEMTFATAGGRKFYGYHRAPHRQLNRTSVVIVQESAFDGAVNTDRTDMQGFVNDKTWGAYWLDEYLQELLSNPVDGAG